MVSLRAVSAIALVAAIPASGFVRNQRSAGLPLFVANPERVEYRVHAATAAGMRNSSGAPIISESSTPTAAILAALETWNNVEGSRVHFEQPTPEADGTARPDGVSLITFADTSSNRAITFGAIAVTRLFSDTDGALVDTDVVFNPDMPFSTTLEAGTFDIQGALTHELGHALGMDHSGTATATMFATTTRASKRLRTLSEDDRAYVRDVYPMESPREAGTIEGTVRTADGAAVNGAIVTAFDPETNVAVSTLSENDGRYRIPQLPPGSYGLIAEPLDGPAEALQLSFLRRGVNDSFRTSILGGAANPTTTTLAANGLASMDLTIEAGAPAYNLIGLSAALPGQEFGTRAGGVVERGGVYEVSLDGEGLDDPAIMLESLRILGRGVELLPAALERDHVRLTDGSEYPSLLFMVRVAEDAPLGTVTLALSTAIGEAALTCGLEIVDPAPAPSFVSEGVVNAATFLRGGVAPGSLVSIFGENLAPALIAGYLDPITGRLTNMLGGVSVRLNGRPAALLFVSPDQINLQTPPDLAAGLATLTVDRDGVASETILVETASAAPGLFSRPEGGALALLADGALNSPAAPLVRGELISLFGVGAGAVSPILQTGELAPVSPLSRVEGLVQVEIGGKPANVTFAGMAPGFAGLLQINVQAPLDAPTGDAVSLLVRIAGAAAPISSLSIR